MALVLLGGAALAVTPATAAVADDPSGGREFTLQDPRLTESSGLAASRAHPGVYWTHNDSPACDGVAPCDGGPHVYAVDSESGKTVAEVTLQGVDPRDLEAVSVGPDGDVYLGDIGDNFGGRWSEVWIYRFPEPKKLRNTTVTPTRYTVQYADGPRDAESLMVHPRTGRVYIASKNDEKQGGVYAGPEKLSTSGVNTFRRIARTDMWATDGAFSPDGTRLVLRSYFGAEMYRWTGEGRPEPIDTVPVPMQRQGESVTFSPDGTTLMYGTEKTPSVVEPKELEGEVLPERAARKQEAAERDGGENGGSGSGSDGSGEDSDLVVGGITFAVAAGLWLGLRRLFRRRED